MNFLSEAYLWIKALHVISVIAWMAGMLYLPRIYAYHTDAEPGSAQSETFKVMERRLLRGIVNPSMIAALVFGGLLIMASPFDVLETGWFWVKVAALVAMFTIHGNLARWRRDFARDANRHSRRFYKIVNEVPAVLMVVIVLMAVVKPF
ncbi:MAG: protoporphyrinogen oxidase HemJ [Alphaproteobacteria bacterium]|jgi:putative membrane protein